MKKICICINATNIYFILGVRLIKNFTNFYSGSSEIKFYTFSDYDISNYINKDIKNYTTITKNASWLDGTNTKFSNILSIRDKILECDYGFYMDADTDVSKSFCDSDFVGESVGVEHFANNNRMKTIKAFDRNPLSKAYIPEDTENYQMYFQGAFFGGSTSNLIDFCAINYYGQIEDRKIGYDPAVNDESYINHFFHYHPPSRIIPSHSFPFDPSCKGGIPNTRDSRLPPDSHFEMLINNKDKLFKIVDGEIVF